MFYELGLLDYLLFIPAIIMAWCVAIILLANIISEIVDFFRNDEEEDN